MLAFVSYDFAHDEPALTKFLEAIAAHSKTPRVEHWSLSRPSAGPEWQKTRKDRIWQADVVIVLVGNHTGGAVNVAEDIRLARSCNVPFFGIYLEDTDKAAPLPEGLAANRITAWDWVRIPAAIDQLMHEGKHHKFK